MSGIIEKMQAEIDELKRKVDRLEGRNIPYIAPKIDWTKLGKALQSVAKATEERKKPKPTRAEIVAQAKRCVSSEVSEYGNLRMKADRFDGYCVEAEFYVNKDKRAVTVLIKQCFSGRLFARGIAKCAPDDCFNVHIGKAIALRRALGKEVPDEYLNAPAPEGVEVGDVVDTYFNGEFSFRYTAKTNYDLADIRLNLGRTGDGNIAYVVDDSARY
ncbi:hypothetical protein [Terribacillus saccharophilus]|uniref:hypothetical protein n=1 Tax=Terribacillus saccharophilus TaxID=361277 RepID=UPI003D271524